MLSPVPPSLGTIHDLDDHRSIGNAQVRSARVACTLGCLPPRQRFSRQRRLCDNRSGYRYGPKAVCGPILPRRDSSCSLRWRVSKCRHASTRRPSQTGNAVPLSLPRPRSADRKVVSGKVQGRAARDRCALCGVGDHRAARDSAPNRGSIQSLAIIPPPSGSGRDPRRRYSRAHAIRSL